MKKIILIILFLVVGLSAQTRRYVNGDIGTSGNGQTWGTAWKTFDDIVWSQLSGGNSYLYISGSADSTVYTTGLFVQTSGTWGHYVYILPGKYSPSPSGHSGKVIIDQNLGGGVGIQVGGDGYESPSWIYIKGFTVRHSGWRNVWFAYSASRCVMDSCEIYETGADQEVGFFGNWDGSPTAQQIALSDTTTYVHHIEFKNNRVWTWHDRDQENDVLMLQAAADIWIHDNFLWQRNHQQGGMFHIDCIQAQNAVAGTKIYNNVAIVDSNVNGHCFILGEMSRSAGRDTLLVYNNYIYNGGTTNTGNNDRGVLLWRGSEYQEQQPYNPVAIGIHNTIVTANNTCTNSKSDWYEAMESNNIFIQMGVNGVKPTGDEEKAIWGSTYGTDLARTIDSSHTNLLWRNYSPYNIDIGGNDWLVTEGDTVEIGSWANWLAEGGDGINDNPELVGNYRTGEMFGQISATSPAINEGTDMTWLINKFTYLPNLTTKDILGNSRVSNPDIGCYEYTATGGSFNIMGVDAAKIQGIAPLKVWGIQ